MRLDPCLDMCSDMPKHMPKRPALRRVLRHVLEHVLRHALRHVRGHALGGSTSAGCPPPRKFYSRRHTRHILGDRLKEQVEPKAPLRRAQHSFGPPRRGLSSTACLDTSLGMRLDMCLDTRVDMRLAAVLRRDARLRASSILGDRLHEQVEPKAPPRRRRAARPGRARGRRPACDADDGRAHVVHRHQPRPERGGRSFRRMPTGDSPAGRRSDEGAAVPRSRHLHPNRRRAFAVGPTRYKKKHIFLEKKNARLVREHRQQRRRRLGRDGSKHPERRVALLVDAETRTHQDPHSSSMPISDCLPCAHCAVVD